jgi:Trk-type K+ transport system membrane component
MYADELAWLGFAVFVLSLSEGGSLTADSHPYHFSIFSVIFEVRSIFIREIRLRGEKHPSTFLFLLQQVSSAFGTVGLSFGYPGTATSLAGRFSPTGQVVLMLVMIAGKAAGGGEA